MMLRNRRMDILRKVEAGEMELDEASRRLEELELAAEFGELDSEDAPDGAEPQRDDQPAGELPVPASSGVPFSSSTPVTPVVEAVAAPSVEPEGEANTGSQAPVTPIASETGAGTAQQAEVMPTSPAVLRMGWLWVFVPGLLLVVAAVDWMAQGFSVAHGVGWGVWLSFIPLATGVFLMWLGWELRNARWLHVHIRQRQGKSPREINLGLPLSTGLIRWGMRNFGPYQATAIHEFVEEFDQAVAQDGPVHLQVDAPEGEQVEIWIDGPRR